MNRMRIQSAMLMTALISLSLTIRGAEISKELPRPDGKPADMSKPVKVFILMGQSNMLGFGTVSGDKEGSLEYAVKVKKKYPYLVDEAGSWLARKDVRNVRVMNFKDYLNDWMTISGQKHIGPEIGIGHHIGNVVDAPVLILKSCIGNRSLGWDLLPPGSEPYEFQGKMVPGYRGTPEDPKGNGEKVQGKWYAGKQYDDDTDSAKQVLKNLDKYYPGAKGYEVAGFLFWQGAKDCGSAENSSRYEKNLVQFIKQLRKDFDAPNAMFVVATLGHAKKDSGGNTGMVTAAQLAVDGNKGKYPEFKGNVASVYSNPFCHGSSANAHYSKHAETYMDIGQEMGRAMAQLLVDSGAASASGVSSSGAGGAGASSGGAINTGDVKMSTSRGYRIWTDANGKKLSATLLGVKDGKAVLKIGNGSSIPVPLEKLSAADNEYINTQR